MNLNLLSWNVRGLNDREKRARICNLLYLWKADVVSSRDQAHGSNSGPD